MDKQQLNTMNINQPLLPKFEYIPEDVRYEHQLTDYWKKVMRCVLCRKLSNIPYKLQCEHYICQNCYSEMRSTFSCPSLERACQFIPSDISLMCPDTRAVNYIQKLRVRCSYIECSKQNFRHIWQIVYMEDHVHIVIF
jgi:hypothetical protein